MRLFIAEKKELASAIVAGLGGGERKDGYFDCGNDIVTYGYGHLLRLEDPEERNPEYKNRMNLEYLPLDMRGLKLVPIDKSKAQLKVVMNLVRQADEIVHAGDPDAEGQLLIDEIIKYADFQKTVKRVLIADLTTPAVKKALEKLQDNSKFAGLSKAAEARQYGDMVYGINMTRLYTIFGRRAGHPGVLSVGRIQTPILGLVVRRDRENLAHKKKLFHAIGASFVFSMLKTKGTYTPKDGDPVDDENRIIDQDFAQKLCAQLTGKPATITKLVTTEKETTPPLPYNLIKLQIDAANELHMKPDQVMEVTQALREQFRAITYNRSDCEYIPEEQHQDAAEILAAIKTSLSDMSSAIDSANPSIQSKAFDTSKVSAHHAIIPTATTLDMSQLTTPQRSIYEMIVKMYVAQFLPNYKYEQSNIEIEVEGCQFTQTTHVMLSPGWKILFGKDDSEQNGELSKDSLRDLGNGETGTCESCMTYKGETKPRPLYTMSTLLKALTSVAKDVKDEKIKKLLLDRDKDKASEHGGIGTPATRDKIIGLLFTRGYLATQKKGKSEYVVSTELGRELYDALPDTARMPDMTALWHEKQLEIEKGTASLEDFMNELDAYVSNEIERVKTDGLALKTDAPPCPLCKSPLLRKQRKKDKTFFWACSNQPECKATFPDDNGKPGKRPQDGPTIECPDCHNPMYLRKISESEFFGCSTYPECKKTIPAKDGKPIAESDKPTVSEVHKCGLCGKGLARRPGKKPKTFWWGCSGFPVCTQTYFDKNGKPDYEGARKK